LRRSTTSSIDWSPRRSVIATVVPATPRIGGRVINWSTGGGVAGAELTFTGDAGATTIRTRDDGGFELAPPAPGRFTLTAVAAPGFLPYAPEFLHSTIHVALARGQVVRGITVFLFPALDYTGRVVDARGAPVPGARIRLLGTPAGEQVIVGGGLRSRARRGALADLPARPAAPVHPPVVAQHGGEPGPDRPVIGNRRVLDRGDRGVLEQVVGVAVAVDQRSRQRTQAVELLEHDVGVHAGGHALIMPPLSEVLAGVSPG